MFNLATQLKSIQEKENNQNSDYLDDIFTKLQSDYTFITGKAGSGKSYLIREQANLNPKFMELGSTTGISAINIGARTINSILGYFDTKSLKTSYEKGYLHWKFRKMKKFKFVIEECSMLCAEQFDIIFDCVREVNNEGFKNIGIIIVGDLAQLPPIQGEYLFNANCWSYFENNIIHLNKNWRQENLQFVKAINYIREGNGESAIQILKEIGVKFSNSIDKNYDGTTLIPNNINVDQYNIERLAKLEGKFIRTVPTRRGKQLKEWDSLIPYELRLKIGAYVMILSNDNKNWLYVNGDCGYIVDLMKKNSAKNGIEEIFLIKLVRNNKIVEIGPINRQNFVSKKPDDTEFTSMFNPKLNSETGEWLIGEIKYHPLRLAYSSTIHKSQGLSLDKVQIDTRSQFFGFPNMSYVGFSRARTPENLVIVCNSEKDLISKIKIDERVKKYI